jgi:hypothetical protein
MIKPIETLDLSGWSFNEKGILIRPNGKECLSISTQGYRKVWIGGREYLCHRIIFFLIHGYCPDIIDHIDRDKLNNRPDNLRESTHHLNNHNKEGNSNNTSGIKGVYWCNSRTRWVAMIDLQGSRRIKRFKDKQDAINQRLQWEDEIDYAST